jgi:hypothetical protein
LGRCVGDALRLFGVTLCAVLPQKKGKESRCDVCLEFMRKCMHELGLGSSVVV